MHAIRCYGQLYVFQALTKLGALKLASVGAKAAADHDRLEHEVAELAAEQRDTARAAHETAVQGRDDPRLQPDRDATTTKSIPCVDSLHFAKPLSPPSNPILPALSDTWSCSRKFF